MPAEDAKILLDHFLDGKTILTIGKELFITKRQAQRRVNDALAIFQRLLDKQSYSLGPIIE